MACLRFRRMSPLLGERVDGEPTGLSVCRPSTDGEGAGDPNMPVNDIAVGAVMVVVIMFGGGLRMIDSEIWAVKLAEVEASRGE